jgi:hypothetical protein
MIELVQDDELLSSPADAASAEATPAPTSSNSEQSVASTINGKVAG